MHTKTIIVSMAIAGLASVQPAIATEVNSINSLTILSDSAMAGVQGAGPSSAESWKPGWVPLPGRTDQNGRPIYVRGFVPVKTINDPWVPPTRRGATRY